MEQQYLSVSALTKYIKRKFDADPYLERVFLTGEISNFRLRPAHQYFSIKDEKAVISAVMYRKEFSALKFTPKEGMKIRVIGRVSVYEPGGNYNLIVEHMEPDGVGALYQAYTELKEKLAHEGLFNRPKKQLPFIPRKIAIVTSPSGAVIRDIITTARRRFPIVQLVLFPTVVQGKESAASIVKNLEAVQRSGDFDLVIVARGGGSIEDLWSFNEEIVVRKIAAMAIPVISSVGHETDTTLADLAADLRAPTPTAAAEMAVPVLTDLLQRTLVLENRLYHAADKRLKVGEQQLLRLQRSFIFRQPLRMYDGYSVKLDKLNQQLQTYMEGFFVRQRTRVKDAAGHLALVNPKRDLEQTKYTVQLADKQLHAAIQQLLKQKKLQVNHLIDNLDLLSPLKIMSKGFSYTTSEDQIVTSVRQLQVNDRLKINFTDGAVLAKIEQIMEDPNDNQEE